MNAGSKFAVGDVLSYVPAEYHCREGMAIVHEGGRVLDTFWGTGGGDRHSLTAAELATAQLQFRLDDYDELDQYKPESPSIWQTYRPDDRHQITSQHGLQSRWFVRHGATPDLPTQIRNAEEIVESAESAVRSAQSTLKWRQQELVELRERASAEGVSDAAR
jgi:hypothetical protein